MLRRIDDPINGCWLAKNTKAKLLVPNWLKKGVAHSRIHRNNYYFWLRTFIKIKLKETKLGLEIDHQEITDVLRIAEFRLQTSTFPSYVMLPAGQGL